MVCLQLLVLIFALFIAGSFSIEIEAKQLQTENVSAASGFETVTNHVYAQKRYLWRDDFENYSVGAIPPGYTTVIPENGSLSVTNNVYASGFQSLMFDDQTSTGYVLLGRMFEKASDVVLEADLNTSKWLEFELRKGTLSAIKFRFDTNGNMFYYQNHTSQWVQVDGVYEMDTWQRVRLETNSETFTYDVYLNEVLIQADIPMGNPVAEYDNIRVFTGNSARNVTAYVDNLAVYNYKNSEAPGEFMLLTPSNGASEVGETAWFSWEPSLLAKSYRLIVADHADFTVPMVDEIVGNVTSREVSGLQKNAEYFWKVIAINDVGETESLAVHSFRTMTTSHPIQVSLTAITDYDYNSLESLGNSRFIRTSTEIVNETASDVEGVIVVGLYDTAGALVDISFVGKTIPARWNGIVKAGFSLPVQMEDYVLKSFVWDSVSQQTLISNEVLYPDPAGGAESILPVDANADSNPAVTVQANYNAETKILSVSGNLGAVEDVPVSIIVIDPDQAIDFIDQAKSGAQGAYLFQYRINRGPQGVYRIYVGGEGGVSPQMVTVEVTEVEEEPAPTLTLMKETIQSYASLEDINSMFAAQLDFRLNTIQILLDRGEGAEATAYMQDFLDSINDPSVQQQQLISQAATEQLNMAGHSFIQQTMGEDSFK